MTAGVVERRRRSAEVCNPVTRPNRPAMSCGVSAPVYTQPLPYGTDLGRQDPDCRMARHGTYTAFRGGCRCPHARDAWRIYQKRRREGRSEPRRFDVIGLRRRVQALWALGHNSQTISDATAGALSAAHICAVIKRSTVTTRNRDVVVEAYRRLSGVPGTSATTRRRAAAAGWPSPVQWGGDIDNPAAVPEPVEPEHDAGLIDEVAVERALSGDAVDLTGAELVAVLQAGVARGEPLSTLAGRLGVNYAGARKMLGGELTPRRAQQQRVDTALQSMAHLPDSQIGALLGVHHQTVAQARQRLLRRQHHVAP